MPHQQGLVRWAMPGWVCLVLLGIYLIYSSAAGFEGRTYLAGYDDFGLGLAIFLGASGIPLGFVIHKTTFFVRWTSHFLCTQVQTPAINQFVGSHADRVADTSGIDDECAESESNEHWAIWFAIDALFSSRLKVKDIKFDMDSWDLRGRQMIDNMQSSYSAMMAALIASGGHSIVVMWNSLGPGLGRLWSIPMSLTAISIAGLFYAFGGRSGPYRAPRRIRVAAAIFAISNMLPLAILLITSLDICLAWLTFSLPPIVASLLLAWIFYRSGRYYHDHIAAHYRFAIRQVVSEDSTTTKSPAASPTR